MFWVLKRTVSLRRFFLSTHNICFGLEKTQLIFWYALLTKGLKLALMLCNRFSTVVPVDALHASKSLIFQSHRDTSWIEPLQIKCLAN